MQNKIKTLTLVICSILWLVACSSGIPKENIQTNAANTLNVKYMIVIANHYFGRKQHITTVTQDSLLVIHDNFNGKITSEKRQLTEKEKIVLCEFLSKFPLEKLKANYINEAVEDGTVIDFSITINNQHKDIYVANIYQNELGSLVDLVVNLLEQDYIGYNLSSVPYKE